MCYRPPAAEIAAEEARGPRKKTCPKCGNEDLATAKVCTKCGAKYPPMKLNHAHGPAGPKGPSAPKGPAAPKAPGASAAPSAPKPPANPSA